MIESLAIPAEVSALHSLHLASGCCGRSIYEQNKPFISRPQSLLSNARNLLNLSESSSSSFIAFCSWTLFFQSCSKTTQSWKWRYLFGRDVLLLDVPGTHGFQSLPCPFPQAQLEEASRMFEGMFILGWSNRGLEPFPSQHLSNDFYKVLLQLQLPIKMILSKMIGNTNMKTEKPLDLG